MKKIEKILLTTLALSFLTLTAYSQNIFVSGGDPNNLDGEYYNSATDSSTEFYQCVYNTGCHGEAVIVKISDRWLLHPMFSSVTFENFNLTATPPCTDWQVVPGNGGITPPVLSGGCSSISSLPIELLYFEGTMTIDKEIKLEWGSAYEVDILGFNIQYSTNGEDWENLNFQHAENNSEERSNYSFVHKTPQSSLNYYRLKIENYNGTYEFSKIVSLSFLNKEELFVYPNPVNDFIKISSPEIKRIKVFDCLGTCLIDISNPKEELNLSNLISGTYTILLSTPTESKAIKILKN